MKFCGQCGNQLDDDAAFCDKCGAKQGGLESSNLNHTGKIGNVNVDDVKNVASNMANNIVNGVNTAMQSEKAQEYLENTDKLCNIGYVGAALGMVSVFFPILSLGGLGAATISSDKLLALAIILIGLFAVYGFNKSKYSLALASGQTYIVAVIFSVIGYQSQMSKLGGFGKLIGNAVSFDLGFYLLVLSAILLVVVSGLIASNKKGNSKNVGAIVKELISMENTVVEVKGLSLATWSYSCVMIVLLVVAVAVR